MTKIYIKNDLKQQGVMKMNMIIAKIYILIQNLLVKHKKPIQIILLKNLIDLFKLRKYLTLAISVDIIQISTWK